MKPKPDIFNGILLLNKPVGISSHGAVMRVRKLLSQRSIGHAGTLDPAAEGLLLLLLGKATKAARFLTEQDKEYEAEIKLGLESTTYDSEGVEPGAAPKPVPSLSTELLERLLEEFRGTSQQKVPAYSAVHVDGERLYKRTRRGEQVEAPVRTVVIRRLDLITFGADYLRVRLTCSKGTYVRSLAHDIGQRLGCGGYLSFLQRTRIGKFSLGDSLTLEQIARLQRTSELQPSLIPLEQALDLSSVVVREDFTPLVATGRRPTMADIARIHGEFATGDSVLLTNQDGSILAIGKAIVASSCFVPGLTDEIIKYERVLA